MCFSFVDLSVCSLSLLLTELRCTLVHLYLSSKYLLFVYNHFLTTTVSHLKTYSWVILLLFWSFFKGSDLFLHFNNVDVVTFVVRELAKSAMSVFVQRNSSTSYVCCCCHKTIVGSLGHVTASKTISLLMV